MRHDQPDEANDADRRYGNRRGKRGEYEDGVSHLSDRQTDDRGLQLAAGQYVELSRQGEARDCDDSEQSQALPWFPRKTEVSHEPEEHPTQVLVRAECEQ